MMADGLHFSFSMSLNEKFKKLWLVFSCVI